jgi:hypothetical protein
MVSIMQVFKDHKNGHFSVKLIILCDLKKNSSLWLFKSGEYTMLGGATWNDKH